MSSSPVPSWIETSLHSAVVALTRTGETAIAADLGRLLDEPELRSLRLYRSRAVAELADELYDCDNLDEVAALLPRLCSAFSVAHCSILRLRESRIGRYGARLVTTYPEDWLDRYMERRYFDVDPTVARALEGPGAFFWDEAERSDPVTADFHRSAAVHGIGPAGITFVGDDGAGDRFAVSISVPLGHAAFRHLFAGKHPDFLEIARILIEVFSELTGFSEPERIVLTEDQLKVLRALASGQSVSDLTTIPVSYGSFATLEASILRSLNATNLMQAVAIAARRRILDVLPFFENDIHRFIPDACSPLHRTCGPSASVA